MDQRKKTGKQKIRNSKSILTVGVITLAAVVALAGISYRKTSDRENEEQEAVIMAEAEWSEEGNEKEDVSEEAEDTGSDTVDENSNEPSEELTDEPEVTDDARADDVMTDTIEGTVTTSQESSAESVNLIFSESDSLSWPLDGDVILNYSMDQSVYFATLDQYKYNPALIIRGDVNDQVIAAATGQVVSVETLAETGVTVTMDIGDGYQLVYGQLKEVQAGEGDIVEEGDLVGFISEPTKYYNVEGSNLYFQMLKDGEPVNPLDYLE